MPSRLKRVHTASQNGEARVDLPSRAWVFQLRKRRPRKVNVLSRATQHRDQHPGWIPRRGGPHYSPTRRLSQSPGPSALPTPSVWAWKRRGGAGSPGPRPAPRAPRRRRFWTGQGRASQVKLAVSIPGVAVEAGLFPPKRRLAVTVAGGCAGWSPGTALLWLEGGWTSVCRAATRRWEEIRG